MWKAVLWAIALLIGLLCAELTLAGAGGRIEGRVVDPEGATVGGVTVALARTGEARVTGADGKFAFGGLPVGEYRVELSLGGISLGERAARVEARRTTRVEIRVENVCGYAETLTVRSASRRVERVVAAPAAISAASEEAIKQQAGHGQAPKVLEFQSGVEVTQSGIYDFNFNTRGFNSSLTRRVATLVDGRDPSMIFLGSQEWAAFSFSLDDIAGAELVRGPGAALYGANASSGVLNVYSRLPRDSLGGIFRVSAGNLETINGDLRWAGSLGKEWYLKVNAGVRSHGDFTVSRMGAAEYSVPCPVPQGGATDCLPQEAVPLASETNRVLLGSVRLDKHFENGRRLTLEGGTADFSGPTYLTNLGRLQMSDVRRPWARVHFDTDAWSFSLYYNQRDAPEQLSLSSGRNLVLDSENIAGEVQTKRTLASGAVQLIVGASYAWDRVDSRDPETGPQTLLYRPEEAWFGALYAQVGWQATRKLNLVAAARYDDSDLHDPQLHPRFAIVYGVTPSQTLRLTYNQAFQVPNFAEYFAQADLEQPLDLSAIEQLTCDPFGVDCGFDEPTRLLGVGNRNLELEDVAAWEIGYSAVVRKSSHIKADYFQSRNRQFITDLLPQLGTALGRLNPDFGPYRPPDEHPDPGLVLAALDAALPPQLRPFLSNNFDDSPAFVLASFGTFGEVRTQGVDLSLDHYFGPRWMTFANYSWFDFEIEDGDPSLDQILLPNAPEHSVRMGVSYSSKKIDASLNGRWVDEFRWATGPFQGQVEAYVTLDLYGNYRFNEHWQIGLNVSDVFDKQHWQAFGGDLLDRRALFSAAYLW